MRFFFSNLLIKNGLQKPSEVSSVVYQYNCDKICYICHTTTTIKERFKEHATIKKYFSMVHGINITGQEITPNVTVIGWAVDKFELCMLEALLIKKNPVNNAQVIYFIRIFKSF